MRSFGTLLQDLILMYGGLLRKIYVKEFNISIFPIPKMLL